jgi:M6 family metalloprotease-like protein
LKVDRNNLRNLVSDTLGQVERDFNLERYDFLVFVLAANAKEWGNQGLNTYPGVLGWKDKSQLVTPAGRRYRGGIAIYALSARPGKVFHNIAHILGGVRDGRRALPDMYDQHIASSSDKKAGQDAESDQRKSQIYMGAWDPMSCNICAQRPGVPGVSSWTKLRLGWLGDSKVRTVEAGETAEVLLAPLSDGDASTLALRIPLGPTTYYLVENRQRIGHDTNVPNAGVLIMYADDAMAEPQLGRSPVRLIDANPSVPFLDGAAFDIGERAIFKDPPNMIEIEVIKKVGTAYVIRVSRGLLSPAQAVAPQWNTTQPNENPPPGRLCRDGNMAHCEVACSKGVKRACDRLRGGL